MLLMYYVTNFTLSMNIFITLIWAFSFFFYCVLCNLIVLDTFGMIREAKLNIFLFQPFIGTKFDWIAVISDKHNTVLKTKQNNKHVVKYI